MPQDIMSTSIEAMSGELGVGGFGGFGPITDVSRGPAESLHQRGAAVGGLGTLPQQLAEAKVGELERRVVARAGEHDVLGLDVAVHHADAVQVLHCRHDLHEAAARLPLRQVLALHEPVEELPAVGKLHDDAIFTFSIVNFN
eukprot:CAMPEP_0113726810 /NCGR_PEP_ID=MMETSP0038_2-20120614/40694_1 /TAXON_ID=2898 /ORGANISM="Cryptomonas paramecium" /LENGTH=141 /DNA_ID=CAMNT_0000657569 /DNA_START=285 /DNA_END=711 /DNA_ORIENTATION=+ /assembly_acc=CAM_ASM_000170